MMGGGGGAMMMGGGGYTMPPLAGMGAPVGGAVVETGAFVMTQEPALALGCGGGGMMGGPMMLQQGHESEVFVEVTPEVVPNFNRGPNGTFFLEVTQIVVRLATQCNPPPPSAPGLVPFKPYEEFAFAFPELRYVEFNPATRQPPNATVCVQTNKKGAILEVPRSVGLNAQLKANSPHGQMVLEDLQVMGGYKQKVGETVLHYKLQVEGELAVNPNSGNSGAHRLEVNLNFTFWAQLQAGGAGGGQVMAGGGMQVIGVQQDAMMMGGGAMLVGGAAPAMPMTMAAGPQVMMAGGSGVVMGGGPQMMF